MSYKKHLIRWGSVLALMLLIFIVSSRQKDQIPDFGWLDFIVKKLAHMLVYAVLAILLYRATRDWRLSLIVAALYGASDEWHQSFVPTRNGQFTDVIIDSVGAMIGLRMYLTALGERVEAWLESLGL